MTEQTPDPARQVVERIREDITQRMAPALSTMEQAADTIERLLDEKDQKSEAFEAKVQALEAEKADRLSQVNLLEAELADFERLYHRALKVASGLFQPGGKYHDQALPQLLGKSVLVDGIAWLDRALEAELAAHAETRRKLQAVDRLTAFKLEDCDRCAECGSNFAMCNEHLRMSRVQQAIRNGAQQWPTEEPS